MNLKKILSFSLGPVLGAIFSAISLPLVSWIFDQNDVGRIALFQVTCTFLLLFATLGLDQAYVREFHESRNKGALLRSSFLPALMILCFAVSIGFVFRVDVTEWLFSLSDWRIYVLFIPVIILMLINRFLGLMLRMNEQALAYSLSSVLPKIGYLAVVLIAWYAELEKDITVLIMATLFGLLLACLQQFVLLIQPISGAITSKFDFEIFKSSLSYGWPLVFSTLAFWGLTSMDRFMLNSFAGLTEVALYSMAMSFASVATILQTVFTIIWAPTVYKWVANNENLDKVHDVSEFVLYVVVALFGLVGIFSWVVPYILPEQYADVQYMLLVCLLYPLLFTLSTTTVIGLNINRKTGFTMLASIIACVLNAALNYYLIPVYGASGAAIASAISFFILFVLRTELASFFWQKLPRTHFYVIALSLVLISILYLFLRDTYFMYFLAIWLLMVIWAGFKSVVFIRRWLVNNSLSV